MTDLIRLNAGGEIFVTNRSTVNGSPVLSMIVERNQTKPEIFIDEDPKIFRHVLNMLRNANYVVPKKYKQNVDHMLDCFGMPIKFIEIETPKLVHTDIKFFGTKNDCSVVERMTTMDVTSLLLNHEIISLDFIFKGHGTATGNMQQYLKEFDIQFDNKRIVIDDRRIASYFEFVQNQNSYDINKATKFLLNQLNTVIKSKPQKIQFYIKAKAQSIYTHSLNIVYE